MTLKKAAALVLSFVMTATLMQTGIITAYADEVNPETVNPETFNTTVTGTDINESIPEGDYSGIRCSSADGNSCTVTGSGTLNDSQLPDNSEYKEVILAEAEGTGSSTSVTFEGSVEDTKDLDGIRATGDGGSAEVTINNGDVTGRIGAAIEADHGGSAKVTINNGDVTGKVSIVPKHGVGASVRAQNGGSAEFTTNRNVAGGDVGFNLHSSGDNSKVTVTVTGGNVKASGRNAQAESLGIGVNATAHDGGTTAVTVTGDVEGDKLGIESTATTNSTDSTVTVTVNGNVKGGLRGIDTHPVEGGKTITDVYGNVKAGGDNTAENIRGISIESHIGSVEVRIMDCDDPNNTQISGNVASKGYGIYIESLDNGEDKPVEILIDGELKADLAAVQLRNPKNNNDENDLHLTVWKADLNKNGNIVEFQEDSTQNNGTSAVGGTGNDALRETIEKSIQYIIKIEQPEEGATLSAAKQSGAALTQYQGRDVACEGDRVFMKVKLQDGFRITAAYSDLGKTIPMMLDAATGDYYVSVMKGGGIYLSAVLQKLPDPEPDPEPQPEPTPTPDPEPAPVKPRESSSRAGYWKQDQTGWFFQFEGDAGIARNTVIYIDASSSDGSAEGYYGFGEDGYMLTGWGKIGDYWYYFDASGLMKTGWQTIDGVQYYFNPGIYSAGSLVAPIGALMSHDRPVGI